MTARTPVAHLASLPCIYINPDPAVERREQFLAATAPLFASAERGPSTLAADFSDDDAQQWIDDWRTWYRRDTPNLPALKPMKKVTERMKSVMACRQGWMSALSTGIDRGYPRFMVCEDDVVPRRELFDPRTPSPPVAAPVLIWQGAIAMGSFKAENEHYEAGRPVRWEQIRPSASSHHLVTMGALEFSASAARALLAEMTARPGHCDHSLGFLYWRLPCVRVYPNLFVQYGPNIRAGRVRAPSLSRPSLRSTA